MTPERKRDGEFMNDRDIHDRAMCGIQLDDRNRSKDMMMFGLNKTMHQLAMANIVCWYGHLLWREDGHV